MRKLWLIWLVLLLSVVATGQSRTTDRVISVPFSQLTSSWPDGSTRIVINGSPTAPCTVGTQQVLAIKLNGAWNCSDLAGTGGGGAPFAATYITQTPNSLLTNEQPLSVLSTGILKSTTSTGVLTIAVPGIDFLAPAGNGSQLTSLNASQLGSGTVPDARFPATLPAVSGINLTGLNASAITTGTVPAARLGTGSGGAAKFLREDSTWQTIPGGGDALTANPLSQFAATTSAQLRGVISDETGAGAAVFADTPTLTTPTIGSFANAGHNHTNAAGGGQLTDAALSTAVSIPKGGTGQTTQTAAFNALDPLTTKGDVLANDGTNSVRLGVGTNGQALLADSTQSSGLRWGSISASAGGSNAQIQFNNVGALGGVTGVTTDGTAMTFGAGNLILGSQSASPTSSLGRIYVDSDDGKPYYGIDGSTWGEIFVSGLSQLNLASANVTGILPGANGGTGNGFFAVTGPATSTKTFTFPNASATVLTDSTPVTIAQGGTGQTTATAAFNALDPLTIKGDLLTNNGTDSIRLGVGTDGQVLTADSTVAAGVKWAAAGGSSSVVLSQFRQVGSCGAGSAAPTNFDLFRGTLPPTANCRGSNIERGVLSFDQNNDIYAQFVVPAGWTSGAMSIVLRGEEDGATSTAAFDISTLCVAGGESVEGTFNTVQNASVATTANKAWIITQNPLTTTGCAAGETLFVKVKRTDSGDTTHLLGVELRVTVP